LIDRIVGEPLGGAHRDPAAMVQTLRKSLQDALAELQERPIDELLKVRFERLMAYGKFKDNASR
jgi:acetyl-CoA carboxylase carboxyl transferase subunit alpha